ncbi:hypothetical protein FQN51_005639 [Onygenales sp. PD_10]|nr:hypothetical protein FQN51_005639 [Onygenales sp. PD_10]
MSPRKSTSSAAEASLGDEEQNAPAQVAESSRAGGGGGGGVVGTEADMGVNVEDYLLPRTLTQRLAKGVLPPNTSIQKDALLAMTKAATVFVSYLSSHANEETEKKTIAPQDVFAALSELEFDAFLPRLQRELDVYTEAAAQKRKGKKDRKAGEAAAKEGEDDIPDVGGEGGVEEKEPGAKRVKRDGEGEVGIERPRPAGAEGEGDDDTEEHEEEDEVMEEEEQEEEEEDEEEDDGEEDEEDEATQLGGREDDIELADASDTARRRMGPDLDESGSDSDGP